MLGLAEPEAIDACVRAKQMGFGAGGHIHLYGERFEVITDPFPADGWISVCVRGENDIGVHVIRLPVTVLQTALEHHDLGSRSS